MSLGTTETNATRSDGTSVLMGKLEQTRSLQLNASTRPNVAPGEVQVEPLELPGVR